MPVPLPLVGPAVLAAAAWLNAKTQFSYDLKLIRGVLDAHVQIARARRRDNTNLFYNLEQHATTKSTADHTFLMYQGKTWTYKEVYDIVLKYGTWLKTKYGILPREVVAMDFMNSPVFVFLWLGIWSLGATPALINYNLTGDPLLHSVRVSTARILFVDQKTKPQFPDDICDKLHSMNARDGKESVQTVFFDATMEEQIMATEAVRETDSSRSSMPLAMAVLI